MMPVYFRVIAFFVRIAVEWLSLYSLNARLVATGQALARDLDIMGEN